jgi:hypothetical protein
VPEAYPHQRNLHHLFQCIYSYTSAKLAEEEERVDVVWHRWMAVLIPVRRHPVLHPRRRYQNETKPRTRVPPHIDEIFECPREREGNASVDGPKRRGAFRSSSSSAR